MIIFKQRGFSIMEVIIAIGIIAVIGVYSSNLLTRTYKTTSDADLVSKLKQNGEVASNNINEAIRVADAVVCYADNGTSGNRIAIRTLDGKYWLYRFVAPVLSGNKVTQNGYIARQENLDPNLLNMFCTINPPNFSADIPITDKNPDTGVSISGGEFKKISGGSGKDTVSVIFSVGPAANQLNTTSPVNIQTTVQVR